MKAGSEIILAGVIGFLGVMGLLTAYLAAKVWRWHAKLLNRESHGEQWAWRQKYVGDHHQAS